MIHSVAFATLLSVFYVLIRRSLLKKDTYRLDRMEFFVIAAIWLTTPQFLIFIVFMITGYGIVRAMNIFISNEKYRLPATSTAIALSLILLVIGAVDSHRLFENILGI